MHSCRILLFAAALTLAVAAGAAEMPARDGELQGDGIAYTFFEGGKARCQIILPEAPAPQEQAAGKLLQDVFRAMGGARIAAVSEPSTRPLLRIHVGRTPLAGEVFDKVAPKDLDRDGFIIHPVDEQNLVLMGRAELSTYYAVTELLERYAGVLWVWPGEVGTVIPRTDTFKAVVRAQVSAPAFMARQLTGMHGPHIPREKTAEMRRWRTHQHGEEIRDVLSHITHKIVRAEMFDTHPEYFPYSRITGQRQRLARWQVCTTNPDVIKLFIDTAKTNFRSRPALRAYSTSAHDAPEESFCQCDACLALDVPGVEGLSDRWFTFVNAVADGIRDEFPDHFIANLAYSGPTRLPPARVKLRPNVIPYLVIPTLNDMKADVVAWSKAANTMGAYFWMHGKTTPQFFPTRLAEYLRFIHEHNVRGVYVEAGQHRPDRMASWELDGPRIWMLSKLLWNPYADVTQLMEVYLTRFYGPAAEPMRRYYQHCERVMERRPDPYDFGRSWQNPYYHLYKREDIDILSAALKEALALAREDATVTARLEAQREAMAHLVSYYAFEGIPEALPAMPFANEADARAIVAAVNERARHAAEQGPLWEVFVPSGPRAQEQSEQAIDARFTDITKTLGARAEAFWNTTERDFPALARFIQPQRATPAGRRPNLAADPSFEGLTSRDLASPGGWVVEMRPNTEGRVAIVVDIAHSGRSSLLMEGLRLGATVRQKLPVRQGERYRISCMARCSTDEAGAHFRSRGVLRVRWEVPYTQQSTRAHPLRVERPLADGTEWKEISAVVTVPKDAVIMEVAAVISQQGADVRTWFDDFRIERLYPPSAPAPDVMQPGDEYDN